jgi:serine phosphatase RsbU (regulator of sigma subunit)
MIFSRYTDSLVESRNQEGEEFGLQRVLRIMEEEEGDPVELTERLWEDLRSFTGSDVLKDDLTIICARREK